MSDFMEFTRSTPVILYQCYRNGTTLETEDTVNVSVIIDGTQSGGSGAELTFYSAISGTENQVNRERVPATYDEETDTAAFPIGEKSSVVTLLEIYETHVQYINEYYNGVNVRKIFDTDPRCDTAQKLYEELCKSGCDFQQTRKPFTLPI